MNTKYLLIHTLTPENASYPQIDKYVSGIEPDTFEKVDTGLPAENVWDIKATFVCFPIRGKVQLPVVVSNTYSLFVCRNDLSLKIKELQGKNVETLPISLVSASRKLISNEYKIVNPIGAYDCLDPKASGFVYSKNDPTDFVGMKKAVLKKSKLNGLPSIFRISENPGEIIVTLEFLRSLEIRPLPNLFVDELDVVD